MAQDLCASKNWPEKGFLAEGMKHNKAGTEGMASIWNTPFGGSWESYRLWSKCSSSWAVADVDSFKPLSFSEENRNPTVKATLGQGPHMAGSAV